MEKLKFNPGLFRILKKEKGRSVFHIKKWLVNYMNLTVPLIGLPTTQAVSSHIWGLQGFTTFIIPVHLVKLRSKHQLVI